MRSDRESLRSLPPCPERQPRGDLAGLRPRARTLTFRPAQIAAVFVVGIIGVLIPGLQPQLLGALAAEGRVSAAALGGLATVELLAMGIAAVAAGPVLPMDRLRVVAGFALTATAALDLVTPQLGLGGLFVARTAAGLGEGALVWIVIALIVRQERPERWSGVYLALQTLAQFTLASVLGGVAAGSRTGFAALGGVTVAGLAALPWLPAGFAPLPSPAPSAGRPTARGLLALAGVLLTLAAIVAIWVYVEPLAATRGVPPAAIAAIAPLSLAMQVLGAGVATVLASRWSPRLTVVVVAALDLAAFAVMADPPSAAAFVGASAVFGFLWLFVMPFHVPIVIAADPTRRAALAIGGAQLIGASVGPVGAGLVIGDHDVARVLGFGTACLLAGISALVVAGRDRHSRPA